MTLQRTATIAAEGFTLLEGPRWHDGMLWLSDFYSHRVLRADVAGGGAVSPEQVCIVEGRPSGLGFMPDGELRISSMLDKRLLAWDGKRTEVVADFANLVTGPANDMIIDAAGTTIIGNFGLDPSNDEIALPTSLLRITSGGDVSVAADDVVFPNGMALDEEADVLYVVESFRDRISAWDYSDGELSNRRVWLAFDEDSASEQRGSYDIPALTAKFPLVPDGIARDAEGMIWVADAKGHGASRVAADGSVAEFVETGLSVYAVVLGGADRTELFLCCAPPAETWNRLGAPRSVLMRCPVDVPGV
jgi:sugar lactone lactonase YvrE